MDEPTVAVGRVGRAHGVRGELSIVVLSEVPERFEPGATVSLEDGRTLTVDAARPNRDRLLVRFREVPDRTAAESLQGSLLLVADVIHTRANDIWSVLDASGSETLIPVLKDVVVSVDTAARRIVVREIPGLTIEEEGEGTDPRDEV